MEKVADQPAELTPGKFILALPSKLTPPIVLAVAKAVAVSALPVTSPVMFPSNVATMVAVLESVTALASAADVVSTALNLSSPSFQ